MTEKKYQQYFFNIFGAVLIDFMYMVVYMLVNNKKYTFSVVKNVRFLTMGFIIVSIKDDYKL